MSGVFVVVEGSEGAGKTTLVAALADRFRAAGTDPVLVREPGGTPAGEAIRALLLDPAHALDPLTELFLFLAARRELVHQVIRPALAGGRLVLADRFQLSTEAYQCGGRGVDRELFRVANGAATGGLQPDLTLVLDLLPEVGFQRMATSGKGLDRIEREDPAFHGRVAETFREARGPGVVHLDATRPPERVLHLAWAEVAARVPGAPGQVPH